MKHALTPILLGPKHAVAVDAYMADAAKRGRRFLSRSQAVKALLDLALDEAALAKHREEGRAL